MGIKSGDIWRWSGDFQPEAYGRTERKQSHHSSVDKIARNPKNQIKYLSHSLICETAQCFLRNRRWTRALDSLVGEQILTEANVEVDNFQTESLR